VSKDEADQAVDGPVLSEGSDKRSMFYLYCRQQGLWPREVTGHDPDREPRAFDPFCPVRNVTKDYPPTMLLHGDRDTDVPYQQSVQMVEELKRHNVEHLFITIPNGEHGFDGGKGWLKDPANIELFQRVLDFLKRHTR
jgi:dipeptidyl aminopeptidase/acylaminoacyl peptidase